ncbi:MAG: hypothetical protein ACTHJR_14535 [Sphingomonas sp.]|uniref:hypothetical protein n=1 Tax=Sphingomonas sp. TaxID=28214 RepID=UPI003F813DC2
MLRERHTMQPLIVMVLLSAILIAFGVVIAVPPVRNSRETWLDGIPELTPDERAYALKEAKTIEEKRYVLQEMKKFEHCTELYQKDGAADALSDFQHKRAKPFWGHSGGNHAVEWVPGFEASCSPPLGPPGVNLPMADALKRGNFRPLDQMGAEFEDGQWRTTLMGRCDRASRTYAARYNRALAKLDAHAFAQCRAVSPRDKVSYDYGSAL